MYPFLSPTGNCFCPPYLVFYLCSPLCLLLFRLSCIMADRAWHQAIYHVPHPILCQRCVPARYLTSQVSFACYWSLSCPPVSAVFYLFWSDCIMHNVYLLFYMSNLTCKVNSKPATSSKERDSAQVMLSCQMIVIIFFLELCWHDFFFLFVFCNSAMAQLLNSVAVACADCLSRHDLQHIVKQLC